MSESVDPEETRYPTTEEISELPDEVRRYIHDLETRCDKAGDLRRLEAAKQKCRELQAALQELEEENSQLREVKESAESVVNSAVKQPSPDVAYVGIPDKALVMNLIFALYKHD